MGFQFKPEPVDKLRGKVSTALNKIWVAEEGMIDRPGVHKEHVFDFENGLRLIISKDKFPGFIDPVIHISSSYPKKHNPVTATKVNEALMSIGLGGTIDHIGDTPSKVAHWILILVN